MKYLVYALAMCILAGSSCKSKAEPEIKSGPEIIKENPLPGTRPTETSGDCHHESCKCHSHKHKRIPPGHAKKMHGEKSARNYAPGHAH